MKRFFGLSLLVLFGVVSIAFTNSQSVSGADESYEEGIQKCSGSYYKDGGRLDYPRSAGKNGFNAQDAGWRGCAQGYMLEKKYKDNMDAKKCTADEDEVATPPQYINEYLDGCKKGVSLADGTKNPENVPNSTIKPENYNDAPDDIKSAAVQACKSDYGDGTTGGRTALSCWEGFVQGKTNQADPCNGSGIADKDACTTGYNIGKNGGGTLVNAVSNGDRLMKEFERDCSTKTKYSSNAARCKKIKDAMAPLCGAVANRETDTLKSWIDECKQKVADAQPNESTSTSSESGTNCSGGAMGWLFCPMIEAMTNTIQALAGLIEQAMEVRFLTASGSVKQIEDAWRSFQTLANILLIGAFLIIIFSQATSAGLSNYNIKRMLPRLVIAAILMNISFYICALAIDMSNIFGGSIMGFLVGDGNSISAAIASATGGENGSGFFSKVAGAAVLIGILIFVLPFVLISIISVFIMLIGRQVILMCLVLASPIAFVAWLLPNTEKYFQKWLNLFTQLLILYPMIMFVFGASLYLSNLLSSPAGTSIISGGN